MMIQVETKLQQNYALSRVYYFYENLPPKEVPGELTNSIYCLFHQDDMDVLAGDIGLTLLKLRRGNEVYFASNTSIH